MGFQKVEFTVPEAVNPYINDVAELAAESPAEANAAFAIDVPAKEQSKHEQWVRVAARKANRTARLRKVDSSAVVIEGQTEKGRDIKSGTVVLTYTLGVMHAEGKGRKGGADAVQETTEATTEAQPQKGVKAVPAAA
jgi:hypothetical protein